MKRCHEDFERLAGAVMLSEATPDEMRQFEAHAACCATCRADAGAAAALLQAIAASREREVWRPSLDHAASARLRSAGAGRFAKTIGVLGWAVAASIVLNVAVASGFTAHLAGALHDTGEPTTTVVATQLEIGPASRSVPAVPKRHIALLSAAPPRRVAAQLRHRPLVRTTDGPPAHAERRPNGSSPAVPDVLAGLDIDGGADEGRTVALQTPEPCATNAEALGEETCARSVPPAGR